MRVLSVNHLLDPVTGGGTAERTLQLCRHFARAGVECTLITLDIGVTRERREELAGTRIVALPCVFRRFPVPRFSWRALKAEVEAAQVVHLMGHWTLLNVLVFLAARSIGRPCVVCPAGALPIIGRSKLWKRLYNIVIGRRIIRGAAGHVAITQHEIQSFVDYGVSPDRVTVIPNGVPSSAPTCADCPGFLHRHGLEGRSLVLFLGRLAYIKGPDLLLEAFANVAERLPAFDLVYAGPDGGMLRELREHAARRGVTARVRFMGYVGGDDKACALQCCELLAIPSRQEAMSIVVLEAGLYGKPVLLTDQCGFNEVQEIGGGRVVSVNAASIESALMELAGQPDALPRMGARLSAFVKQNYTWDGAVAKYRALFAKTAGPRTS